MEYVKRCLLVVVTLAIFIVALTSCGEEVLLEHNIVIKVNGEISHHLYYQIKKDGILAGGVVGEDPWVREEKLSNKQKERLNQLVKQIELNYESSQGCYSPIAEIIIDDKKYSSEYFPSWYLEQPEVENQTKNADRNIMNLIYYVTVIAPVQSTDGKIPYMYINYEIE